MDTTRYKKYPLQIAISTLFIVITVFLGLILSWQSFNKTSDIMLDTAEDLYERITQEVILDFRATYGPVAGGLHQFRLSPVIKARTFEQRVSYLQSFLAVLDSESSVFGVGVGYENGDYFGITSVDTDYVRENYTVPVNASYLLLYIKRDQSEPGFDSGKRYTIFYDEKLKELSRSSGVATQFDSRLRPWYQQATDSPHATKPYVFYKSKIVGLAAMSKTAEPGVVVVFDITLENLSKTISKYQVTPSSEVVLINADGQTFAYGHQEKVVMENSGSSLDGKNGSILQLANLSQLGSGVLAYVSKNIEVKEQDLAFDYNGRHWIGSARIVAKPGGVDLYALILSPR